MDTTHPRLRARRIAEVLFERRLLDPERLVALLGPERHQLSVVVLEQALARDSTISETQLAEVLAAASGLPVLPPRGARARALLPPEVSQHAGAIVVDRDPPTVAFVEDRPEAINAVTAALGRDDFEVWLVAAPVFAQLWAATYQGAALHVARDPADIFEILDQAMARRASDVHLATNQRPVLRIDGRLVELDYAPVSPSWLHAQAVRLVGAARMETFPEHFSIDAAYSFGTSRFRINVGADRQGLTIALRKLPTEIPTPDELGLPPAIRNFCNLERGLVLVTGPTGSGKSTTLASLLNEITTHQSRHIITLEDPIEFVLPSKRSIVHQREFGESFTNFADGIRQALRQDPDVILVGEMRDLETMRAAITAAETGHLVFATLHTFDATSTIGRIVNQFSEGEQNQIRTQLAYILKGVVSQTLLPLAGGRPGRVAAFEIMVSTPAVANNLRKADGLNALRQTIETSVKDGMQTMDMALADLVRRGQVDPVEARFRARSLEDFDRRVADPRGPDLRRGGPKR